MLADLDAVKAALKALGRTDLAETVTAEGVEPLLQEASDLVTGYLWPSLAPDPTPDPIKRVTASMVAVCLTRPTEILPETQQLSADGFGVTFTPGSGSPGPYLTAAHKARLRPFRSGMTSVPMSGESY
ncbi:head-to-tail adaptor [Mycobacterium phage ShedlockHolmes]|uniref:Head-to-tail adaptor n=3 Tax=Keshuvirus TaxID=2948781 RepID=G1D522_9CAUD|nr:head-to-tail adaptor [Mycobacterium phage ShedlockHolmes]YP_009637351.1 head-to-tail adaptor [Mycobacterium phage Pixie]AEK09825.1 head-to-tail adaptor [Mycobacterium phage Pixie]AKF15190.1 head-to-tail adaptor [Mycobacterium phage ShedlockHolmes]AOT23753.1 head-to-tail adaptor [Mycobacterium phage TBond007]